MASCISWIWMAVASAALLASPRLAILAHRSHSAETAATDAPAVASPTDEPAAPPTGAYKPARGPCRVVTIDDYRLADSERGRPTPLRLRFPVATAAEPGPFPLVVFSHGMGGSSDAFGELSAYWARHGYIVVHPTHSDSLKLRRERGDRISNVRDALAGSVKKVDVFDRRADVLLVLDRLDELERAMAAAAGDGQTAPRVDRKRLAMAGHSAGALTTQMMAGLRFIRPGLGLLPGSRRGVSYGDERFSAFIVISGQGTKRAGITKDSWKGFDRPTLVIAGSADVSAVGNETPASRRHPFEYAPPGDKYLIFIDGATHGSYAGGRTSRLIGETPPAHIDYITSVTRFGTLAFLDAYLRHDAVAREYLASEALARVPGGKTEISRK